MTRYTDVFNETFTLTPSNVQHVLQGNKTPNSKYEGSTQISGTASPTGGEYSGTVNISGTSEGESFYIENTVLKSGYINGKIYNVYLKYTFDKNTGNLTVTLEKYCQKEEYLNQVPMPTSVSITLNVQNSYYYLPYAFNEDKSECLLDFRTLEVPITFPASGTSIAAGEGTNASGKASLPSDVSYKDCRITGISNVSIVALKSGTSNYSYNLALTSVRAKPLNNQYNPNCIYVDGDLDNGETVAVTFREASVTVHYVVLK